LEIFVTGPFFTLNFQKNGTDDSVRGDWGWCEFGIDRHGIFITSGAHFETSNLQEGKGRWKRVSSYVLIVDFSKGL
jgi:hypothetical protein